MVRDVADAGADTLLLEIVHHLVALAVGDSDNLGEGHSLLKVPCEGFDPLYVPKAIIIGLDDLSLLFDEHVELLELGQPNCRVDIAYMVTVPIGH